MIVYGLPPNILHIFPFFVLFRSDLLEVNPYFGIA